MIHIIKKFKILFISTLFSSIYLLMILFAPSQNEALIEGGITNINNTYHFVDEGYETNNNLSTIYVSSYYLLSVFQQMVLEQDPSSKLIPKSDDFNIKDSFIQSEISNESMFYQAMIVAYHFASIKDPSIYLDYEIEGLYIYYQHYNLAVGSLITKINDTFVNSTNDLSYLKSLMRNQEELTLIIDDKEVVTSTKEINLIIYPKYKIKDQQPLLKPYTNRKIGGPSGGMMQTLYLYLSLLKIEIDQDIKISGTGTINVDDNYSVGSIGGITQKVLAAISNKQNYIIIPKVFINRPVQDTYNFSKKDYDYIESLKSFIEIRYVDNFLEVLEVLENEKLI